MYDKMFSALNPSLNASFELNQSGAKGDLNTSLAGRQAIEDLQKQFQDQMQTRIAELEDQVQELEQKLKNEADKSPREVEKQSRLLLTE